MNVLRHEIKQHLCGTGGKAASVLPLVEVWFLCFQLTFEENGSNPKLPTMRSLLFH